MKVLIAVEDKVYGTAIADFASKHKWPDNTEFKIINAVDPLVYMMPVAPYPSDVFASFMEERERAAKALVLSIGTMIRQALPLAKLEEEVLTGQPKSVIIDTAKAWAADMIIVGSHGRSGLGQFFLGSVSMSVLSAAPCSVLVIKLPKDSKTESPAKEVAVAK